MILTPSTFWQTFINLIVWFSPILLCVFALDLAAGRGLNPSADR